MWDKETPLLVLKTMPNVLEEEHLKKLQLLLDTDRYKNQIVSGIDVCGIYAPFCLNCNKEIEFPCAKAYINYLKDQGMYIQIASDSVDEDIEEITDEKIEESLPEMPEVEEPLPEVENVQEREPLAESVEEAIPLTDDFDEQASASESIEELTKSEVLEEVTDEVKTEEEMKNSDEDHNKPEEAPKKTRIRIAIARKKTIF